jgi:hypothetical protein
MNSAVTINNSSNTPKVQKSPLANGQLSYQQKTTSVPNLVAQQQQQQIKPVTLNDTVDSNKHQPASILKNSTQEPTIRNSESSKTLVQEDCSNFSSRRIHGEPEIDYDVDDEDIGDQQPKTAYKTTNGKAAPSPPLQQYLQQKSVPPPPPPLPPPLPQSNQMLSTFSTQNAAQTKKTSENKIEDRTTEKVQVSSKYSNKPLVDVKNELERAIENRARKATPTSSDNELKVPQSYWGKPTANQQNQYLESSTISLPPPPPINVDNLAANGSSSDENLPPPPSPNALNRIQITSPPIIKTTSAQSASRNNTPSATTLLPSQPQVVDPRTSSDFSQVIAKKAAEKRAKFQETKPTVQAVTYQSDSVKFVHRNTTSVNDVNSANAQASQSASKNNFKKNGSNQVYTLNTQGKPLIISYDHAGKTGLISS